MSRHVLTVACALLGASAAFAGGTEILDFAVNSNDGLLGVGVAADGRIFAPLAFGVSEGCGMFGLDADGTPAAGFGAMGRAQLSPVPGACSREMRVQSDGSMYMLENNRLVKRDAAGAVVWTSDVVFPVPPAPAQVSGGTYTLDVQADGRILVFGTRSDTPSTPYYWMFARLNGDGSRDGSFGIDGVRTTEFGATGGSTAGAEAVSIIALPSGKFVASGTGSASTPFTAVMRFNADGSVDSTFGTNGRVQLALMIPSRLAVDATGRIHIAADGGSAFRLLADGSFDGTYNNTFVDPLIRTESIVIDSQGRAVLFGRTALGPAFVVRYTAAGSPDTSFNGTGMQRVDFGLLRGVSSCYGTLQSGDRSVLGCAVRGMADLGVTVRSDVAFARLTTGGSIDSTFAPNAVVGSDYYPDAIVPQTVTVPYGTAFVSSLPVLITGIDERTSIDAPPFLPTLPGSTTPAAPLPSYSVGCTRTYVTAAITRGTIGPNEPLCVLQSAPSQPGVTDGVKLTIGGRVIQFPITTTSIAADTVPDAFTFTSQTDVAQNVMLASNRITVTGITGLALVTVTGGQFSPGCADSGYISVPFNAVNGMEFCVRHTTASAAGTTTTTTLTVGGVAATYSTTTAAAPANPAPGTGGGSGGSGSGGGAIDWFLLLACSGAGVLRVARAGRAPFA